MSTGSMVVLNGELMPRSGARIGVDDAGFLLGDGVFETLRAESGVPLQLDAHLARLGKSLAVVGIALPWRSDELRSQVALALEVNALRSGPACVRITVTRGVAPRPGFGELAVRAARRDDPKSTPTVLVTADPYKPPAREAYERGVDVEISANVRHPHPMLGVKSTSYAGSLWLRREASHPNIFEVLQFNAAGSLAEGSFANVFVVDADGVLRTPAPEEGCLEGVTRSTILDLAHEQGQRIELGGIDRARLGAAAEVFLTSSLVEIVPVRSVGGRKLSCPGPITLSLRNAYLASSRAGIASLPTGRSDRSGLGVDLGHRSRSDPGADLEHPGS